MTKTFAGVAAVKSLSLEIYAGEILVIVGPSGCGKTTLLQLIAGLERPDEGVISIAGEAVFSAEKNIFLQPDKRQVALVFQNYALWPHYNVFQNVAYPLRIRRVVKNELREEVKKVLSLVKLDGKERRYPHELSGGEQQRVALARALAMKPRLLLLDEPLSNLDAKLKEEMQDELKGIQKEAGLTIVHVTHDQHEAMGIADRIAVMKDGRLLQVGSPKEIYEHPNIKFIAEFIGKTNVFYSLGENGQRLLKLADGIIIEQCCLSGIPLDASVLSVRPEDIVLNSEKGIAWGKIASIVYRGNVIDYGLSVGNRILTVQTSPQEHFEIGEKVWFSLRRATPVM